MSDQEQTEPVEKRLRRCYVHREMPTWADIQKAEDTIVSLRRQVEQLREALGSNHPQGYRPRGLF